MHKIQNFILIYLFIFSSHCYAEESTFQFTEQANKWRLEQYNNDRGPVLWYTPSQCNNGYLDAGELAKDAQNRFYALILLSKLNQELVTIYYSTRQNQDGTISCILKSFAADF